MAQITMPKMSDTMEEGKVIKWLKHEGDQVNAGEPVAEIETDKANVEMEAFEPGVIKQILVQEGQEVPVGAPIATLEAPETAGAPAAIEKIPAQTEQPEIPSQVAPGPSMTDQVPLVTTPPSPEAAAPAPEVEKPPTAEALPEERIPASPLARRMAEENRLDLSKIHGTGPNGRITESDVQNYMAQTQAAPAQVQAAPVPAPAAPTVEPAKPVHPTEVPTEEHALNKMRKTIAERMARSKQTIPHFYVTSEVDMDWVSRVRDELNAEDGQVKISFTDIIIKACALALGKFPSTNASFAEDKLLLHKQINVGMAVALEDGLVVPVIHDADKKHLRDIAVETKDLAKRARENALHMSDLTGATFTVSNLGMFDVEEFSAIINPPESASLAIGTIREVPVVMDGEFAASKRMKVTLSADHRVMDGADGAKFLQEVKRRIESPISLL